MATDCFFPDNVAAHVTPPAPSGTDWAHINATGNVVQMLVTVADSSTLTTVNYAPDGADDLTNKNACHRRYVSKPLAAQTLSGNITSQFQILEDNAGNNLFLAIKILVCSEDGTTTRATLLAITRDASEPGTTIINRTFPASALTSYACAEGDRLVIEIGLGGTPTAAGGVQGHNGSLRWGCNASSGNLPADDTQTGTTYRPWINFATTVTFKSDAASGTPAADAATMTGEGDVFMVRTLGIVTQFETTIAAGQRYTSFAKLAPITGDGTITMQAATMTGAGEAVATGTGALTASTAASVAAVGTVEDTVGPHTVGILTQFSTEIAAGQRYSAFAKLPVTTGDGTLTAQAAAMTGAGTPASTGTATMTAQASALAGASVSGSTGTSAMTAQAAALTGAALSAGTGSGAPVAQASTMTGPGLSISTGTSTMTAQGAALSGIGGVGAIVIGTLTSQTASLAGAGVSRSTGTAAVGAGAAAASGAGIGRSIGSAAITAATAAITGIGTSASPPASGALVAGSATLFGTSATLTTGSGALGESGSRVLTWSAATNPDHAGYVLYEGTGPGDYAHVVDVGNVTSYTWNDLSEGPHYFVVLAYDTADPPNYSDPSPEQSVTIAYTYAALTGAGTRTGSPIKTRFSAHFTSMRYYRRFLVKTDVLIASGALTTTAASISGSAALVVSGVGILNAQAAAISSAALTQVSGSGALNAQAAQIISAVVNAGTGAMTAGDASLTGTGSAGLREGILSQFSALIGAMPRYGDFRNAMPELVASGHCGERGYRTISWTPPTDPASADLAGYYVGHSLVPGGPYAPYVDVGNVTSYTTPPLSEGAHYFVVQAYDATGNVSVDSAEAAATIAYTHAVISGDQQITATTGSGVLQAQASTIRNSTLRTQFDPLRIAGRRYGTFAPRALPELAALQAQAATITGAATVPILVTSAHLGERGYRVISWTAPPELDVTGYRVWHGLVSGGPYPDHVDVFGATTTSYQWNNLTEGWHYFAVEAFDTAGLFSGFSEEASVLIAYTYATITGDSRAVVTGTGVLIAQAGGIGGTGVQLGTATGALSLGSATLIGFGFVQVIGATGVLIQQPAIITGSGLTTGTGAGVLLDQSAALSAGALTSSSGSGALIPQVPVMIGAAITRSIGSGVLAAQRATVNGQASTGAPGQGLLPAQHAVIVGAGVTSGTGAGVLTANPGTLTGFGTRTVLVSTATGALTAAAAQIVGVGLTTTGIGLGALAAQAAHLSGSAQGLTTGSGILVSNRFTLNAPVLVTLPAVGILIAGPASIAASGAPAATGSGALQAGASMLDSAGIVFTPGHLTPQPCQIVGIGWSESTGIGVLIAGDATMDGGDQLFDPLLTFPSADRVFVGDAEPADYLMRASARRFVFAARGGDC